MTGSDCPEGLDPGKLVRGGTRQAERAPGALHPSHAPIDVRTPAQALVFASGYTSFVRYVRLDDQFDGTWHDFFASDISNRLAVVAIADVGAYRSAVTSAIARIMDIAPTADPAKAAEARQLLGEVFSRVGTLARRLDDLHTSLHPVGGSDVEVASELRATLDNLIRSQLAKDLQRLVAWFAARQTAVTVGPGPLVDDVVPTGRLLGAGYTAFSSLLIGGLSPIWPKGVDAADWAELVANAPDGTREFGTGSSDLQQIQHLAGHAAFRSVLDRFLRAYARSVVGAAAALEASFAWNGHQPHNALLLTFVRLLEHIRAQFNTLTAAHRDFYYGRVLGFRPRPAIPSKAHVLVELAKHVEDPHRVGAGTVLRAGKDDAGQERLATVDRDLVANRAKVVSMRSVYRHHREADDVTDPTDEGRIYASPVARSADGLGAELTSVDGSWHPFVNATFADGKLQRIDMPPAEIGFAIASHHLLMAEGERSISVKLHLLGGQPLTTQLQDQVRCRFTTADGWFETSPVRFRTEDQKNAPKGVVPMGPVTLDIKLSGGDPAIVAHDPKVHGVHPDTALPVLQVLMRQDAAGPYRFDDLAPLRVSAVDLLTVVGTSTGTPDGLRTVLLSNDLGELDPSKPFQPFGPSPRIGSTFVIGSKELFQKRVISATITVDWSEPPTTMTVTKANGKTEAREAPSVTLEVLENGAWGKGNQQQPPRLTSDHRYRATVEQPATVDEFDPTGDEPYTTSSRSGFLRLRLSKGFGQDEYAGLLASAIVARTTLPVAPVIPTARSLSIRYSTEQSETFTEPATADDASRLHLFHIGPFGSVEVTPNLGSTGVPLVPQFVVGDEPARAELLLGIEGLRPPQQLALLFQVADGTANPLAVKPRPHLRWGYLRDNTWVPFASDAVDDGTDELLVSGIVTLAVPADAQLDSTVLPAGTHWVRVAVTSAPDTVCKLVEVAPQALRATVGAGSSDPPALPAGTVKKLAEPDPAVKAISQPFPTFGGRAEETNDALAARASERLRHKDRASTLWDYERLVLEAFPALDQVRCLNHTRFGPDERDVVVYDELAPGHVTVVTIPDLQTQHHRDPLRPATSLGVLAEIETFLRRRTSCFVQLHVRNPQFEEVGVDVRVRFRPGTDETFHRTLLQQEITRFLSPWAFPPDAGHHAEGDPAAESGPPRQPSFNGRVRKSVVLNFVEERPYVDYVADFELRHRYLARSAEGVLEEQVERDVDEVTPSRAIAILVSVPASGHGVRPILRDTTIASPDECLCEPRATR